MLDGGTDTVSTVGGKVALNLMPMVQLVLEQMAALVPDLIGRNITIPEIDISMAPSEAVSRLESAFGIDLPDGFGTVVVYDADELEALQKAVRTFDKLVIVLVLLVLVLVALALWLSPRRRRTLLQLMTGFAVGLVVVRRIAIAASDQALESARPENQAAAHAFTDRVLGNLLVYTGWLLAVVLVVLVIAWLTGSYPAPVAIRRWVTDLARSIGGAVTAERPRSPAVAWIQAHREPLMFAVAAVALLVLLIADVSLLGLLVILAVAGIIELVDRPRGYTFGGMARAPCRGVKMSTSEKNGEWDQMLILAMIVLGMAAGWVAQLLLRGRGRPIDWPLAFATGIAGSFVGGLVASLGAGDGLAIRPSGLIGSILGAVIVLALVTGLRKGGTSR